MGSNKGSKKGIENILVERIGLEGLQYLYKKAQEKDLNLKLFLYVVRGMVSPIDGKKWPKSWCKVRVLEKRLNRGQEYWDALRCNGIWWKVLQEWNALVGNKAKQIRVFGKVLLKEKVYPGSRKFWDFLVLVWYMCKYKVTLVDVLKRLNKIESGVEKRIKTEGVLVIEDGEDTGI